LSVVHTLVADANAPFGEGRAVEPTFFFRLARRYELAVGRFCSLQRAEIDIGMYVRLYDAHEAGFDFLCVNFRNVPEVSVQSIFAGCQNGQLRAALAAVQQEHLGIQHLISELCRERVSKGLTCSEWRSVLCWEDADFAPRDTHLEGARAHLIQDVHQYPWVKPGRQNAPRRTFPAGHGDNSPPGKRPPAVHAEKLTQMPV